MDVVPSKEDDTSAVANSSSDHQSFRHNFQAWVDSNYGEHSRTKTITRSKYTKICRYLMGEEVETDAKFRFWVKSKAFRILRHQLDPNIGVLCVRVSLSGVKGQNSLSGFNANRNHQTYGFTEFRQVAVVDDFYSIIRSVHISKNGVHVGQKKTYRAVSQTYAFLPREAVSYYLMSCSHCKLRIQTSNSIIVKHGVPPVHVDSDQEVNGNALSGYYVATGLEARLRGLRFS